MEPAGRLVTSTRHEPNAINRLVGDVLAGAGVTTTSAARRPSQGPKRSGLVPPSIRQEAGHCRELPGVVAR